MDNDTRIAVSMDIDHIDELYGKEGLKYALVLIEKMLDGEDFDSLEELEEWGSR